MSQESTKSDFDDHSANRNRGGDDLTQSTSLTRSTSTGSRFTEGFSQDVGQEKVEEKEKKGLKSSTLLFKRRSLKSAPPPPLNKTTSRTDTFKSTTSQDSLQSASSRRIPSFATRSNGSISPSLPSSPRSGNSMKLAPIQSGSGNGTRQREKSNPSPTSPVSRNGNLELTPQDRHYICRILTKWVTFTLIFFSDDRWLMNTNCSSTALNSKENSLHSPKSVLCHITVPPSSLTRTDQTLDRLMQGRRKGKVGSVS